MAGYSSGLTLGPSFKKFVILSSSAVLLAAVPVAVLSIGKEQRDKIWSDLTGSSVGTTVKDFFKKASGKLSQSPDKISSEAKSNYSSYSSQKIEPILSSLKTTSSQPEKILKDVYSWSSAQNLKDTNFHIVNLGGAIKSMIKHVPTILRDSIRELYYSSPENDKKYEFLSIQKIMKLVSNGEFSNLVPVLTELGNKRRNILSKMTTSDGDDLMRTIAAIMSDEPDKVSEFLKKVKNNAEAIKEIDSFTKPKEFLFKVLFGEAKENKDMEEFKKALEGVLEKMSGEFKAIAKESIESIKKALESSSNTSGQQESAK